MKAQKGSNWKVKMFILFPYFLNKRIKNEMKKPVNIDVQAELLKRKAEWEQRKQGEIV
jgi:hypothetical protein